MYSDDVKNCIRRAYVHDLLTLKAAAKKFKIPEASARRWKQRAKAEGDDWEKARSASRMARGSLGDITAEVLEEFAVLFKSTIDDLRKADTMDPIEKAEAISRLADAYTKTMKAAAGGDPKLARLSVAMQVLDELSKFIRKNNVDLIGPFAEILAPFGKHISTVLK